MFNICFMIFFNELLLGIPVSFIGKVVFIKHLFAFDGLIVKLRQLFGKIQRILLDC